MMYAMQVLGLLLSGVGFALCISSLVFRTTCVGGLLVAGGGCTVRFHWPSLALGLGLQGVGGGVTILSEERDSREPVSD